MQPSQEPQTTAGPSIREEDGRTIVKARHAGDLLGLVPHLVGVEPADSLVVVVFRGKRTAGALRLDLPPFDDERALQRWSGTVLGMVCKVQGVDGIAPVVYTDRTFGPSGRPPHAALLRAVDRRAARMGFAVKERLVVAADGWGSLDDPDLPRGGRLLEQITVLDDARLGEVRQRGAVPIEEASGAAQERFLDHYEAWWTRPEGPGGVLHDVRLTPPGTSFGPAAEPPAAMERYRWGGDRATVLELIERALDPHDDAPGEPCACLALVASFAEREGLNGIVLVQWGWGRETGAAAWAAAHDQDVDSPALDDLGRALSGDFRRPDADRLHRAVEVVTRAASMLPADLRAPLDAMLAWLHWALGSGSIATALAERSASTGRDLDLALMVQRLTASGGLPEWAFTADPGADPLRALRGPAEPGRDAA